MTRVGYFDLANGISGDMALAALAHAGRSLGEPTEETISDAVASIDLDCAVAFIDDARGGIACLRAEVKTGAERHTATELRDAITSADANQTARARASAALDELVRAEATVHGIDPERVHLHELASADTVADLLGAAVGLEALNIGEVAAAPVPVPTGWVNSEHGPLPLPAPATLEILVGAALIGVASETELVTPSGAAILVGHAATFGPLPAMTLEGVGVGAGSRIGDRPNICRLLVGTINADSAGADVETCVLLETNIDDQTPEAVGYAIERLLAAGALDAWITPIVMKKSRPAFLLSVLVRPEDESRLVDVVFHDTTTLGLRRTPTTRHVLDRDEVVVSVAGHSVRVKIGKLRGEVVNVAPEFEDCATAATATGLSLNEVFAEATHLGRSARDI